MSQIIDITERTKEIAEKQKKTKLDAQASYTAMKKCLEVLELNSLSELRSLKAMMRRTMKDMISMGKNGKKERSR
jgi:hypothetical protein